MSGSEGAGGQQWRPATRDGFSILRSLHQPSPEFERRCTTAVGASPVAYDSRDMTPEVLSSAGKPERPRPAATGEEPRLLQSASGGKTSAEPGSEQDLNLLHRNHGLQAVKHSLERKM